MISSDNSTRFTAYTAKVRISVRAGPVTIIREGCGSGEAKAQTPSEAHELALKAAETDATKRALATFGNPFGLALYDRDLSGVRNRKALERNGQAEVQHALWVLRSETGQPKQSFGTGETFLQTLKQAMSEAPTIELLFALMGTQCRDSSGLEQAAQRISGAEDLRPASACRPFEGLCRRAREPQGRAPR